MMRTYTRVLSRVLSRVQRLVLVGITLLLTIGCDQASKSVAIGALKGSEPLHFLGGMFRLQYSENPGAFLGLGGALPGSLRFWILIVAVSLAMGLMISMLIKRPLQAYHALALSLIASGGVSNLLDRLFRSEGRVVDFLNVGIGPVRTGIFNVADMAIMAGVGILLIASFKISPARSKSSV